MSELLQPSTRSAGNVASAIAQALVEGFNKHYRLFRQISREAKGRFERAEWQAVRQAHAERIQFYDDRVAESVGRLQREFDTAALPDALWQEIKLQYVGLLTNHKQPELAETFFNSVSCKILQRSYYHNDFIFVRPAVSTEYLESDPPAYRSYYPLRDGLRAVLRQIFADCDLKCPFSDLGRDLRFALRAVRAALPRPLRPEANHQIQVLSGLFFRNQRTYLIGKIINGNLELPFAVPIVHAEDGDGLCLDAILLDAREIAVLFAFSRAYFMVDMEVPSAYVEFLASMLPGKPRAELYTSLGLQKHGKTLFYRDFLHHLQHSTDAFVIAPGIRGLVMIVFTLPSYPYVFKVIRDAISPVKNIDRQTVKDKYLLVKRHDRVGRMADTLEYTDVAFPRSRFDPELIEELEREVPSLLEQEGDTLIVKHLYIERRMTPLNIYLDRADDQQVRHAVHEYGNAIKELASANIFPGDMLLKNFGVTRHNRVVFYDYDEIAYMTDCNFRRIPPPTSYEDEMAAEPYWSVGPHDVFPEQFERFLVADPHSRAVFMQFHGDLTDPAFWAGKQDHVRSGIQEDVFSYPEAIRFRRRPQVSR